MGNIVLLDDLTINKIAAGEVIERPASVIKEMVENSIDAGANNITVEIRNGGISYIKITDNGKGIAEDDLEIAFERHATSKIRSADDLNTVTSMGFRGEALASIAAIARVEMVSKTAEQENGYKVVVEGGKILDKTVTGSPVGTSITVTNLFYNTPVRYKFLKKDFTEAGYIEDTISRIALVHPEIAIKLINTGRTVIQTNGNGDLKTVIYSIYGKDIANSLIETDYTYEDMHVYGVIGKPEIARSNRANQIFFVNKRFIKDKALSSAAEKAYKGMIPLGKFSFLVLNIDMNPSKVDVNVHPAKLEVRFEEENMVFKAVYHAIKDSLLKAEAPVEPEHTSSEKHSESSLFGNIMHQENIPSYNNSTNNSAQTIVEQIYNSRQQQNANNIEPKTINESGNYAMNSQPIEMPDLEKSQEVLKKLQEMKAKLQNEITYSQNDESNEMTTSANTVEELKVEYEPEPQEPVVIEEPKVENEEKIEEQATVVEEPKIEEPKVEETKLEEPKVEEPMVDLLEEIAKASQKPIDLKEELSKALEKPSDNIIEDITYKTNKIEDTGYSKSFEEMYQQLFGTKPVKEEEKEVEEQEKKSQTAVDIATLGNESVFDKLPEYQKPTYKFIGIIFDTYIIIEMNDEMYIIDQNAANEKIMYEKIRANYYNDTAKDSQLMLLPDIITLNHKQMEIAKDNMQMFRKAGFTIEEFGENTIKLTGVPEICLDLETREMFLETLDEINTVSRNAKQEIEERFLSTIASKAAVKVNKALTQVEVDNLMDKLLSLPNPFSCPHGRPIAIKMSKYDIERKFARK